MNNNMSHDESEYPPSEQGTYKDRIDVLVARIEDHITLLLEGISIDELSAYEREQLATKYCGLLLRLLPLLGKVEADEAESHIKSFNVGFNSIGEPKIPISTAADEPESYDDED
jgi:hypothetical protein